MSPLGADDFSHATACALYHQRKGLTSATGQYARLGAVVMVHGDSMPQCIYCRAFTTGTEGVDHPLPRALGVRDDQGLPPGAVCERRPGQNNCNNYFSNTLDKQVCDQNQLAALIVLGDLPGRHGRRRREIHPDFSLDVGTLEGRVRSSDVKFSEGRVDITHPGNPFDFQLFSRGLHRIALGIFGVMWGPDLALDERFDPVRQYIRWPRDRRIRPYYQRMSDRELGNRSLPRWIEQRGRYVSVFASDEAYNLVYINLFVNEFIVALHGDISALPPDEMARRSELPDMELSRRPWLLLPEAAEEAS